MRKKQILEKYNSKTRIMILFIVLGMSFTMAQENSINILNTVPSLDVGDYKPGDIRVYKTFGFGQQAYGVAFFILERDSLRYYAAFYCSTQKFDKAFYNWENDSTVVIRLHNTKDKIDNSFKVFGYMTKAGRTSGMSIDD